MKVKLIAIGKTSKSYYKEIEDEFLKRLTKYVNFEFKILPDVKNAKNLNPSELKNKEAQILLTEIQDSQNVYLLDEKGKHYTSEEFANLMNDKMIYGEKNITFVIGGAFGFAPEIYGLFNQKIAISKMTFTHQMIRGMFVEQLYRAFTIIKNEPYHK